MSSETAKRVAGTHVVDSVKKLKTTLQWATKECRHGSLSGAVVRFCEFQQEILEPGLVLVESIDHDRLRCRIPCKLSDCESPSTFDFEVTFTLDPLTGDCRRV